MVFMNATKENMDTCRDIVTMLHDREITVEQSCAILDYVKRKIMQDTVVGKFIPFGEQDF